MRFNPITLRAAVGEGDKTSFLAGVRFALDCVEQVSHENPDSHDIAALIRDIEAEVKR